MFHGLMHFQTVKHITSMHITTSVTVQRCCLPQSVKTKPEIRQHKYFPLCPVLLRCLQHTCIVFLEMFWFREEWVPSKEIPCMNLKYVEMTVLTFVSGACANMENPSKIYSWSSYSITVGLSVLKKQTKPPWSNK